MAVRKSLKKLQQWYRKGKRRVFTEAVDRGEGITNKASAEQLAKRLWGCYGEKDKQWLLKYAVHDMTFLSPQPDHTQLEIRAIISISLLFPMTSSRD